MKMIVNCGKKTFDLSTRTHIMGVINCTPDSFYSGSRRTRVDEAVAFGLQMAEDGADFLDVGGESSRPGSDPVSEQEELDRVLPVIQALSKSTDIPISIDTYKASIAEAALEAGALMINDISALRFDANMSSLAARYSCPVVLMHIKGRPKQMQKNPTYDDVVQEIFRYFEACIASAEQAGVKRQRLIVDPGIGFGKRLEHNYEIIRGLSRFQALNCPILIGASRKSLIQRVLDLPPEECVEGTIAIDTIAVLNGAHILRVHDVKAARRAAAIADHYLQKRI